MVVLTLEPSCLIVSMSLIEPLMSQLPEIRRWKLF